MKNFLGFFYVLSSSTFVSIIETKLRKLFAHTTLAGKTAPGAIGPGRPPYGPDGRGMAPMAAVWPRWPRYGPYGPDTVPTRPPTAPDGN